MHWSDLSDAPDWGGSGNSIKKIVIEPGCTRIGSYAFYHCENCQEVELPEWLLVIGEGAFSFNSGLESLSIPDSVTEIEMFAFLFHKSLREVYLGSGLKTLE